MGRKLYTAEQIISMLRKAEVPQSQGMTIGETSRKLGISEQTYYRWSKEYGECGLTRPRGSKSWRREYNQIRPHSSLGY